MNESKVIEQVLNKNKVSLSDQTQKKIPTDAD
jgi:hypothetical protein